MNTVTVERTNPEFQTALGRHLLLELYDCKVSVLDDVELIKSIMIDVANAVNATIISTSFHHFSPQGVSGVVVIAESHFTIHTWPEYGYAAIDIFTCDETLSHEKSRELFVQKFAAKSFEHQVFLRGRLSGFKTAIVRT